MNKEEMLKKAEIASKLLGILFILGFGVGSFKFAPDNACVLVVDETRKFYPCVDEYFKFMDIYKYEYKKTTYKEAKKSGYIIDRDVKEQGYFMQEGRSLSGKLLQKIGILSPIKSKWNPDGSWK